MKALLRLAREIGGLFFDDGSLAIVVLVVLGLTTALAHIDSFGGPAAMAFLVGGVIAALVENVIRTARTPPSRD
jgi:uncharacterized protein (DUF2062 family)